jgi:hypothetical protein
MEARTTERRDAATVTIKSHHALRSETMQLVISIQSALTLEAHFGRTYSKRPETLQKLEALIDAWSRHVSALESTDWDTVNPATAVFDWRAIPFLVLWCGVLYVSPVAALCSLSGALFGSALAWSSRDDTGESVPAQLTRECQHHITELPPLLRLLRQQTEFPAEQVLAQCERLITLPRPYQ